MIVVVEQENGWCFNGFHKKGSEVECSESVYNAVKDSVKLKIKDGNSGVKVSGKREQPKH